MNCYISRDYPTTSAAGGKAKTDIEQIMSEEGFRNIGLRQTVGSNKLVHFLRNACGVAVAGLRLHSGDTLVLQYPMKKYFESVCRMAHRRGAKVVTVIHDLGSFRRKKLSVEQEIARLSLSDVVIAHNGVMAEWLRTNGLQRPIVELGIFDYLGEASAPAADINTAEAADGIFFVGSLSKESNPFIYTLGQTLQHTTFYLYGGKFDAQHASGIPSLRNMGFARDVDLMASHKGLYGLSWYGESLATGSGRLGEYMHYNNPHKVSLYLRCGVPVIMEREAGLATFVRENGCGLLVDSLENLDDKLAAVSPEAYRQMQAAAQRVGQLIASGHYFRTAFALAKEIIQKTD